MKYKNKVIDCLICARGGSKGLKNKNIKLFAGKPLIEWTFNSAKKLKEVNKIYLSSDSNKIINIAKKNKILIPVKRPKYLASDKAKELDVWKYHLNFIKNSYLPDVLLILPPASPLRNIKDIKKGIKKFFNTKCDVLITVTNSYRNPYFNMVKLDKNKNARLIIRSKKKYFRRQDAPRVFDVTTVFYIVRADFILKTNNIFQGKVKTLNLPKLNSIDIDDIHDFKYAETIFKKNK